MVYMIALICILNWYIWLYIGRLLVYLIVYWYIWLYYSLYNCIGLFDCIGVYLIVLVSLHIGIFDYTGLSDCISLPDSIEPSNRRAVSSNGVLKGGLTNCVVILSTKEYTPPRRPCVSTCSPLGYPRMTNMFAELWICKSIIREIKTYLPEGKREVFWR